MKVSKSFALVLSILILVSCKSQETKNVGGGELMIVTATPDDERLRQFFEKRVQTNLKNDRVIVNAILQLPEIEIPRGEEIQDRLGVKPNSFAGEITAAAGYVCIQNLVVSENKLNYVKEKWTADLWVDGIKAKSILRSSPRQVFDMGQGSAVPQAGQMDLVVCSEAKFAKVSKVTMILKDKLQRAISRFDWAAPWPPLHLH